MPEVRPAHRRRSRRSRVADCSAGDPAAAVRLADVLGCGRGGPAAVASTARRPAVDRRPAAVRVGVLGAASSVAGGRLLPSRPTSWPPGRRRWSCGGRAAAGATPEIPPTADHRRGRSCDDIDVVVEVIGGIEPTRTCCCTALEAGVGVVTANKALLAEHGPDAVRGGRRGRRRPLLRGRRRRRHPADPPAARIPGRRPDLPRHWGSSTAPPTSSCPRWPPPAPSYDEALERGHRLGYAEADPTADVDGFDAAAKAAILASIGFHTRVGAADVHREGIAEVSAADIAAARRIGCTVKLLAICERVRGAREPEPASRLGPGAPGDAAARRTRWPPSTAPSTRSTSRPRPPAG